VGGDFVSTFLTDADGTRLSPDESVRRILEKVATGDPTDYNPEDFEALWEATKILRWRVADLIDNQQIDSKKLPKTYLALRSAESLFKRAANDLQYVYEVITDKREDEG
jgi:hypothetical protein